MSRPAFLVVAAQKGGVGKTTTTVELASALLRRGCRRILVVDMDPQANATARLGVSNPERTLNDVFEWVMRHPEASIADAIVPTEWDGVDLVASEKALKFREGEGAEIADYRLRKSLDRAGDRLDEYDLIIGDTPPAGGPLLRNAMVGGDYVLVVTDPEPDGLTGAADAFNSATLITDHQNPQLTTLGILINRYNATIGEHSRCAADLVDAYGELVWRPWTPERASVKTARGYARPVSTLRDSGAREYLMVMDSHADHLISATTSSDSKEST